MRSNLCIVCEKEDSDNIEAGTHKRCSYGKHVVAVDQFNHLAESNCKECTSLAFERKQARKAKEKEDIKEDNKKAGSKAKRKHQCNDCGRGKSLADFLKEDVDTGVITKVDQCVVCRAKAKKRRQEARMKKVNKKMQNLAQAPALCTGPGLPWLDRCLFLPGLQEVQLLTNKNFKRIFGSSSSSASSSAGVFVVAALDLRDCL